jgi:hypothetical protein
MSSESIAQQMLSKHEFVTLNLFPHRGWKIRTWIQMKETISEQLWIYKLTNTNAGISQASATKEVHL